jgi:hypothetical protein
MTARTWYHHPSSSSSGVSLAKCISGMKKISASDALWWMVQWGNEYLARFKRDGTKAQKTAHAAYKKWTADTKQKQMAGFTASLRSAAGADDSLNQSLE